MITRQHLLLMQPCHFAIAYVAMFTSIYYICYVIVKLLLPVLQKKDTRDEAKLANISMRQSQVLL